MINRVTLTSFLKQECCNFFSNECLGVDVFGKRFREQGICYIVEKTPCVYFVKCVLPVAKDKGYGDVISRYQRIDINSKLLKMRIAHKYFLYFPSFYFRNFVFQITLLIISIIFISKS